MSLELVSPGSESRGKLKKNIIGHTLSINKLARARSHPLRGDMVREIITNLVMAPIVIADITDENPNVYWELGVRHSFEHGTIIIAEEGTKRRFDIGAARAQALKCLNKYPYKLVSI